MLTREWYQTEASRLLQKGSYQDVVWLTSEAIKHYPNTADLYLYRLRAYNCLYQPRFAIEDFNAIDKDKLNDREKGMLYTHLAISLMMISDETILENISADNKEIMLAENSELKHKARLAFYQADQFEGLFSYKKDITHFSFRGKLLFSLENWREALECFIKCVEIEPKYKGGYYYLANCYYKLNNNSKCLENCVATLALEESFKSPNSQTELLEIFENMLKIACQHVGAAEKIDLSGIRRGKLFRAIKQLPIEKQAPIIESALNIHTQLGAKFYSEYPTVLLFKKETFIDKIKQYKDVELRSHPSYLTPI